MVQTIQGLKPTRDEVFALLEAAKQIKLRNEEVPCPRCGKPLKLDEYGKSFRVMCEDDDCIRVGSRGI
jgi:transposase-like protein